MCDVTPQLAANIKKQVFESLYGTEASNTVELLVVKDLLEKKGHHVELLSVSQAELKKRFVANLKAKHDKIQEKKEDKSKRKKFDLKNYELPEILTASKFADERFLYGWMIAFKPTLRMIERGHWYGRTEVDAAHCNGEQILFSRCFQDANRSGRDLGGARFNDTENKNTGGLFNDFLVKHCPALNSSDHVSVQDAQKGGIDAHAKSMSNADLFNCANHAAENVVKKCKGKHAGEKYRNWATATTTHQRQACWEAMGKKSQAWVENRVKVLSKSIKGSSKASLAVLQAPANLRGNPFSNVVESKNNCKMNARLTNLARSLVVFTKEEADRYAQSWDEAKRWKQRGFRVT